MRFRRQIDRPGGWSAMRHTALALAALLAALVAAPAAALTMLPSAGDEFDESVAFAGVVDPAAAFFASSKQRGAAMMTYKGYYGSISYDDEDRLFYGKVEFVHGLISYEGRDLATLRAAFEEAVDDLGETGPPPWTKR